MELTEFIAARLYDWESGTDDDPMKDDLGTCEYLLGFHFGPHEMRRIVDSLRAIMDRHKPQLIEAINADGDERSGEFCTECAVEEYPCPTVRDVGAIWSDYPEYQQAWRA